MIQLFRNLSIRGKLFAGFGAVLAVTVILGVVMLSEISSVNSGGVAIASNLPSVQNIGKIGLNAASSRYEIGQSMLETNPAKVTTNVAELAGFNAAASKLLAAYGSLASPGRDTTLWHSVQGQWAAYLQATSQASALAQNHSNAAAPLQTALVNNTVQRFAALQKTIVAWQQVNTQSAAQDVTANASTFSSAQTIGIALLVLAVLTGLIIAFLLSRSIKRNVDLVLERLTSLRDYCMGFVREGMEAFAAGDLTKRYEPVTPVIENPGQDEIGQVATAVNGLRERIIAVIAAYNATAIRLGETIGQVSATAYKVCTSSSAMVATSEESGRATEEIAQAVTNVAEGAERQVQLIEAARESANEVGRAVTESAANATQTAEVALEARHIAQEGVSAAEQANAAMQSVRESSTAVSTAIGELASKSGQIGAIVNTITGIAEQTNLLALNAAIEAARAGDQGRGFAVVAEEVRKLAEESQRAAQEISGLVSSIQGETDKAVNVVEDGARRTQEGAAVVEQTREAFLRIGDSVDDMTARVQQIAAVSAEIAASAQAMQHHIDEVAAVAEASSASTEEVSASTEETSASTQEIAASADSLATNAAELNQLVRQFTRVT